MKWKCFIPGKDGTLWEGGFYPLTMTFTEDYPAKPPKVRKKSALLRARQAAFFLDLHILTSIVYSRVLTGCSVLSQLVFSTQTSTPRALSALAF